jgi:hypothetical protein
MKIDSRAAVFFDRPLVDAKTRDGGVVESDTGQFDVPMEWRLLLDTFRLSRACLLRVTLFV